LSYRTGGAYYTSEEVQNLAASIAALPHFKPRDVVRSDDFELWNRSWMLVFVVGLFAVEWFMRKRSGML
ncbi:MAG: hypothetical protein ACRDGA_07760, partial [Bacteroidota bacterium]